MINQNATLFPNQQTLGSAIKRPKKCMNVLYGLTVHDNKCM